MPVKQNSFTNPTEQIITLVFYNQGLRSYIEVDLCSECPRQDEKGCCAHYSPVFYPTDFAYLLLHQADLIDTIFALEHLTILDASVTANHSIDGDSFLCAFHTKESGCLLPQKYRESICRHFVCSGIGWWQEESLAPWRNFFEQLAYYEIELNNRLATSLSEMGHSLRDPEARGAFFEALIPLYLKEISNPPDFFSNVPTMERVQIQRPLQFGLDWEL